MRKTQPDYLFITCIFKRWANINKNEQQQLTARKNAINSNFSFTEVNAQKLKRLNELLHKREIQIHDHAKRLRAIQKEWLANKWIDDFEIEYKLTLWDSYYDQIAPEFKGNPFYNDSVFHFGINSNEPDEVFLNDNWNEFQHFPDHPLSKDFHCYTFHHIYDHTYLSWEDIIYIEEVWIEIEVKNQFFIDIV